MIAVRRGTFRWGEADWEPRNLVLLLLPDVGLHEAFSLDLDALCSHVCGCGGKLF